MSINNKLNKVLILKAILFIVVIQSSIEIKCSAQESVISNLDLVQYAIIESELKKNDSIYLINRSDEATPNIIHSFKSYREESKIVYWNKLEFSGVKYLNKDSLVFYQRLVQEDKMTFKDFVNKVDYNIIINLLIPSFNEDKSKAIIEVRRANLIEKSSSSSLYSLHKKKGRYVTINERNM